jgi:hypothetical protein
MLDHGVRFLEASRREIYGIVAVFEDLCGNRRDLIERAQLSGIAVAGCCIRA